MLVSSNKYSAFLACTVTNAHRTSYCTVHAVIGNRIYQKKNSSENHSPHWQSIALCICNQFQLTHHWFDFKRRRWCAASLPPAVSGVVSEAIWEADVRQKRISFVFFCFLRVPCITATALIGNSFQFGFDPENLEGWIYRKQVHNAHYGSDPANLQATHTYVSQQFNITYQLHLLCISR